MEYGIYNIQIIGLCNSFFSFHSPLGWLLQFHSTTAPNTSTISYNGTNFTSLSIFLSDLQDPSLSFICTLCFIYARIQTSRFFIQLLLCGFRDSIIINRPLFFSWIFLFFSIIIIWWTVAQLSLHRRHPFRKINIAFRAFIWQMAMKIINRHFIIGNFKFYINFWWVWTILTMI